jgi:CHAD domain-containing protein
MRISLRVYRSALTGLHAVLSSATQGAVNLLSRTNAESTAVNDRNLTHHFFF